MSVSCKPHEVQTQTSGRRLCLPSCLRLPVSLSLRAPTSTLLHTSSPARSPPNRTPASSSSSSPPPQGLRLNAVLRRGDARGAGWFGLSSHPSIASQWDFPPGRAASQDHAPASAATEP